MSAYLAASKTWPAPNYIDPITKGDGIAITSVVFAVAASFTVIVRLYTRFWITSIFGLDDVFIVIAAISGVLMMAAAAVISADCHWNRHIWDIPLYLIKRGFLWVFIMEVSFTVSTITTKLSLLWFCRRLLVKDAINFFSRKTMVLDMCIILLAACGISFLVAELVQCRPLKAYWDIFATYPYTCFDTRKLFEFACILNSVTDVCATIAPITLIWQIKLPRQQKIMVSSIFGLGILVGISGVLRAYYVYKTYAAPQYDFTWVGYSYILIGSIEIGLGLIVASAPALRPFLNHMLPRIFPSTSRTKPSMSSQRSRISQNAYHRPLPLKDIPGSAKYSEEFDESLVHERPSYSARYAPPKPPGGIQVTRTVDLQTFYQSDSSSLSDRPVNFGSK